MKLTIHREGYPYVTACGVLTILAFWWLGDLPGFLGLVLTVWCVYFFRDPERAVPQSPDVVISPADGVVCMITEAAPPPDLELGDAKRTRVSVFMNVFDCHVNRMPMTGTITKMAYWPGKFLNASLDKSSDENERQSYQMKTESGKELIFVQIAGLVARRIVPFVEENDTLSVGERFGMIRFGSRVDVYLDEGMVPNVSVGQRCFAGETILCDMRLPTTEAPTARLH